jgi:putative salt-induced outer membrane protein
MIRKLITLAVLSSLSSHVFAEEEKRAWDATAELGFNLTSGNTDTASLKTRIDVKHHMTNWENTYVFDTLKIKDEEETTADKRLYSAQGNYIVNEASSFLSVSGVRTEDTFGSYDNTNTIAFGYGKRFYNSDSLIINADIGPGYTFFEENKDHDVEDDGTPKIKGNSSIVRLSGDLSWEISDSATFTQKITINKQLSENKNANTRAESGISARINDALKMKFGVTIINNSYVSSNSKKTDTETSVTLVYAF